MARTRKHAAARDPATVAAMPFEPLDLDLKEMLNRPRFLENAGNAYLGVGIGAAMLTKTPAELAAALKVLGEDGAFGLLDDLADTRTWFAGFVQLLEAVEARVLVAASRVAVEA